MIHIDVLIAEVVLEDDLEFGVEWGLQDGLLFDRRSSTGGTLGSPVLMCPHQADLKYGHLFRVYL